MSMITTGPRLPSAFLPTDADSLEYIALSSQRPQEMSGEYVSVLSSFQMIRDLDCYNITGGRRIWTVNSRGGSERGGSEILRVSNFGRRSG